MPTQTPYYDLTLYNATTDNVELFSAYRAAVDGISNSNMTKIDDALAGLQTQITTGINGSSYVSATEITPSTSNYQVSGITEITAYTTGLGIVLNIDVANNTASTLNINSLGAKSLKKIGSAGTVGDLAANDLIPGKLYYFVYNGTYWIFIGTLIPQLSANRIVTTNTVGDISSDTGLQYDSANNELTLGDGVSPLAGIANTFHHMSDGTDAAQFLFTWGGSSYIKGIASGGTKASPTAILAEDNLLRIQAAGYNNDGGTFGGTSSARILFVADENFATGAIGGRIDFYTTPTGTSGSVKAFTINGDGNVNIATGKTYNINGVPHTHGATGLPKSATMWYDEFLVTVGNPIASQLEPTQNYNVYSFQDTPALNDANENGFIIDAGTYTLNILGYTSLDCAISTIYVDGTSIGTLDWYSAASVPNVIQSIASVVLTAGYHKIEVKAESQNGSSTDYYLNFTKIWLTPSAF